jgi:hypothetical protein
LPPVDTSNIRSTMSPNNATPPIPSNTTPPRTTSINNPYSTRLTPHHPRSTMLPHQPQ